MNNNKKAPNNQDNIGIPVDIEIEESNKKKAVMIKLKRTQNNLRYSYLTKQGTLQFFRKPNVFGYYIPIKVLNANEKNEQTEERYGKFSGQADNKQLFFHSDCIGQQKDTVFCFGANNGHMKNRGLGGLNQAAATKGHKNVFPILTTFHKQANKHLNTQDNIKKYMLISQGILEEYVANGGEIIFPGSVHFNDKNTDKEEASIRISIGNGIANNIEDNKDFCEQGLEFTKKLIPALITKASKEDERKEGCSKIYSDKMDFLEELMTSNTIPKNFEDFNKKYEKSKIDEKKPQVDEKDFKINQIKEIIQELRKDEEFKNLENNSINFIFEDANNLKGYGNKKEDVLKLSKLNDCSPDTKEKFFILRKTFSARFQEKCKEKGLFYSNSNSKNSHGMRTKSVIDYLKDITGKTDDKEVLSLLHLEPEEKKSLT